MERDATLSAMKRECDAILETEHTSVLVQLVQTAIDHVKGAEIAEPSVPAAFTDKIMRICTLLAQSKPQFTDEEKKLICDHHALFAQLVRAHAAQCEVVAAIYAKESVPAEFTARVMRISTMLAQANPEFMAEDKKFIRAYPLELMTLASMPEDVQPQVDQVVAEMYAMRRASHL